MPTARTGGRSKRPTRSPHCFGLACSGRSTDDAVAWVRRARGTRKRPAGGWESLTPTERQVVALAAEGLTNPEIGERMFIARGTVKIHLSHIYAKLGARNRSELVGLAARRTGQSRAFS